MFLQVCCVYHSVFGLSFDAYIRACAREAEKLSIFPDADAIKHRNIAFKGIFGLSKRIKLENGIVIW